MVPGTDAAVTIQSPRSLPTYVLAGISAVAALALAGRGLFAEAGALNHPLLDLALAGLFGASAARLWRGRRGDRAISGSRGTDLASVPGDALDALPDGLAMFDADDRLVFANTACRDLFPLAASAFDPGVTYRDLMRTVEHSGAYAAEDGEPRINLRRMLAGHRRGEPTLVRRLADGRWLRISEHRTRGGGTLTCLRDVSVAHRCDEALRRRSRIVEAVSEAVIVVDEAGCVADLNPAASALLGYEAQALEGQPVTVLYPDAQAATVKAQMERVLALQGHWQGQLVLVRQDGIRRVCESVALPLDPAGAAPGGDCIIISRDVSERHEAQARLDYLTHHDILTGLPNRALFLDRLEQGVRWCEWRRERLAVIFLDLDNFQLINRGLGHQRGDDVLREVAGRLGVVLHQGDTLARLGGDKFALIQTGLRRDEQAAFRARFAMDQLEPAIQMDDRELRVSACAGIAVYPADGMKAEALIQAADIALTRAKAEGRNGYHFYVEGMTEETRLRCELEHDISRALQLGEFLLHYQPQIDLHTGRLVGCEALMRWQHPRLGLLLPDQFIPIAEETGAIVPLGEWCLRAVCAQVAAWRAGTGVVPRVAINLSPVQFSSPNLVESVARALQEAGIPASCLELEITESAAMRDPDHAVAVLMHLNELGVCSVIDDFGTGYSSLSHLKRFPVHSLKVDQSFVAGLAESDSDGAIVQAVIELGHSLNMRVTAEGIETEAQAQFLRKHRCDYGQGHSFSRALPAGELPGYIATRIATA